MGNTYIHSESGQRDAVTVLFARMACKMDDGPCKVCLDFCREFITPRAYPIIKEAIRVATVGADIRDDQHEARAFGALMGGAIVAAPAPWRNDEDPHS